MKKWAGDTFGLLDHVYFETEPMKSVDPGDSLDFSRSREHNIFDPEMSLLRSRGGHEMTVGE